ncbi:MAG: hypothetical protein B7Y25_03145 [Alphaproteobacteria bacterium 16-39-46]|nr:MAG: hypothetical protein B7Y25_03145 [Alphaproteobacteria bacterium 16-39-46]OZA43409.1 MAG: hypothetical protein B7X84_03345 [Alphaproteobacteria bacterium 17-39-52]HQS83899.1 hypothetical protein [Alphaproteobacteria bacterium]HQS93712.1 hypothetical protein [Alphaproteobacteria bacterium]
MDWTQTFTIISTIIAAMVAVWYAFYLIIKEDVKRHDEQFSKMDERFIKMDERFTKMDERFSNEFSKRDTLWASLLDKIYNIEKQIYEIKLDQSKRA